MSLTIAATAVHEITRSCLTSSQGRDQFAEKIVSCCLEYPELFRMVDLCVNYDDTRSAYDRNDFTDPILGLVFAGMQSFARVWQSANPWPESKVAWAMAVAPHYELFFRQNPEFPVHFKTAAIQRLVSFPASKPGDCDLVCDGLADYVLGIRYQQAELISKNYDPAKRRELLDGIPLSIRVPGQEAKAADNDVLLSRIFGAHGQKKPFCTGITKFDYYYGARAIGGDAWLAFGCPGGGKTNLACQTAGHTAAFGKRVAVLTTEVKPEVMLQRACSATTRIPYATLRSMAGSSPDAHPHGLDFVEWVRNGPGKKLRFFDYRRQPGNSFTEKLHRMVDAYCKEIGDPPELVVLDWVGKALDESFDTAWGKREAYQRVGTAMADLADELDELTLTLAQAKKECKNRINLTDMDTADCGSLSQPFEGVIGITSLLDVSEGSATEQEIHRKEQYLVVPKCREDETLRIPVLRQFEHARFSNCA